MGNGADKALYRLKNWVEEFNNYLEGEEQDREQVAGYVHELNSRYIDYAHLVDMAEVAVVD